MDASRRPGNEDLADPKDRGDNSVSGYGDHDREPHPLQVDPGGASPAEEPEGGRGRDPGTWPRTRRRSGWRVGRRIMIAAT